MCLARQLDRWVERCLLISPQLCSHTESDRRMRFLMRLYCLLCYYEEYTIVAIHYYLLLSRLNAKPMMDNKRNIVVCHATAAQQIDQRMDRGRILLRTKKHAPELIFPRPQAKAAVHFLWVPIRRMRFSNFNFWINLQFGASVFLLYKNATVWNVWCPPRTIAPRNHNPPRVWIKMWKSNCQLSQLWS